ncbi:cupredoxin domain-containing protein [Nguyenibacter vanlangensis]|uniref:Cupredoxin domain-containing protein n=1 Tax=Nguyenibacter vanlangensis TaxID=1216886 RepID=A0ABZ3DC56_9PROT
MRLILAAGAAGMVLSPAAALAQDPVHLVVKNHHFSPDHVTVPAGQRFLMTLTNQDDTVDEFESYDMKFEKIVVQGGTITVHAGPLHPGTYKFFDDYHPDLATGTVTADGAAQEGTH